MHNGWPDKHRPQDIASMALAPEVRDRFTRYLERGVLPRHLILFGPPGWGKTTIAEIIRRQLYENDSWRVMDVDATKSGNVAFIRDSVTMFMKLLPSNRLVIFHEASGLSGEAAAALREPLERFADGTRVIFTTNYVMKMDEAIRSRCDVVEIGKQSVDVCAGVVGRVLAIEGVQVSEQEVLQFTLDHFAAATREMPRDMRSLLGSAQNQYERNSVHPKPVSGLVEAIRAIFASLQVDQITGAELIEGLRVADERWKDLNAKRLVKLLEPLGIGPKQLWFPGIGNKQGYRREWFVRPGLVARQAHSCPRTSIPPFAER